MGILMFFCFILYTLLSPQLLVCLTSSNVLLQPSLPSSVVTKEGKTRQDALAEQSKDTEGKTRYAI